MLTAIKTIRNAGVFAYYSAPSGTSALGKYSLVYGWNYSGKTTLSRVIRSLETRRPPEGLPDATFRFEFASGPVTESDLSTHSLIIKVFNSDFVEENLRFDGGASKPILLLGKDSIDDLNALAIAKDRSRRVIRRLQAAKNRQANLESALAELKKDLAKRFRSALGITQVYTATHLDRDLRQLPSSLTHIPEEQAEALRRTAFANESDRPNRLDAVSTPSDIASLIDEAEAILQSTPNLTQTIAHIAENPELERWIEDGLHFHDNASDCAFCGTGGVSERLELLRRHFSRDFEHHKRQVEGLLGRVSDKRSTLNLPDPARVSPILRSEYLQLSERVREAHSLRSRTLDDLDDLLQKKLLSPRSTFSVSGVTHFDADDAAARFKSLNELFDRQNSIHSNFDEEKKTALETLFRHRLGEARSEIQNRDLDGAAGLASRWVAAWAAKTESLTKLEDDLTARINKAQLGREVLNKRIEKFLGSGAVKIDARRNSSGGDDFFLVREGGQSAKHLSDGEQTAIAFAYFLSKLDELTEDEFGRAVIYIDDPISSLDANHLFQVTAAINARFFSQNQGSPGVTCGQLIVSTHNFHFLDLLRELKPGNGGAKLFLIQRVGNSKSSLGDMPKSLAKYRSEYQFLFSALHAFRLLSNKQSDPNLPLLPNVARRFIELYTYSRIPQSNDRHHTVDNRAALLMGPESSKRILKLLHHFSHGNTVDRLAENSELIFDLEGAIDEVFNFIELHDNTHWKALVEAVS